MPLPLDVVEIDAMGAVQDLRIAALEFEQPPALAGVIGERIIGNVAPARLRGFRDRCNSCVHQRRPRGRAAIKCVFLAIISQSGLREASDAQEGQEQSPRPMPRLALWD